MRLSVAALAGFFIVAVPAAAQQVPASSERLEIAPPLGWEIGFHEQRGNVELTELTPAGQSVQDWSEMLTVQLITGRSDKTPQEILKDLMSDVEKACEDSGSGAVSPGVENGYDYALRAIVCTKSKKWGKGELNLYKVIKGRERMYIISRAWRGDAFDKAHVPVSAETTKSWLTFMHQVAVCDLNDAQRPCQSSKPAQK